MGDRRFDDSATIGYFSRSTNDRGVEGISGFMDKRGLFERKLDNSEDLSSIFRGDKIIGCTKLHEFKSVSSDLSGQEIKGLKAFSGMYGYPGIQGTACLFIIADVVWGNLGSVYRKDAQAYFDFIERLIYWRDELEKRTKASYRLFGDTENRKPLPRSILTYYPFSEYSKWKEISSNRKKILSGKWVILEPIPIKDEEAKKVDKTAQEALDKSLKKLEEKIIDAQLLSIPPGDSPILNKAIGNLKLLTLENISRQTDVKFHGLHTAYSGNKLLEFTELIIYHSVFSVVLDKTGDPFAMPGYWDYPILVSPPGHVMERHIPPPPGGRGGGALYISVAKYGDGNFIINGGQVKKMLFGGVAGFVENYGGNVFRPHEFQKAIQAYIDRQGGLAYVASISVNSVVDRNILSIDSIKEKVSEVVTAALPYTFLEVAKRLEVMIVEGKIEYYQAFVKEVGEGFIRNLITDEIKKWIKEFLVEKIGRKLIPLIDAVYAAYELFSEAEEREREQVRHAIAYMILAIKGKEKDDMTIAAKGLSKIMADKFRDRIVAEITKQALKKGIKIITHEKPTSKGGPPKQKLDRPANKPEPPLESGKKNIAQAPPSSPAKKLYDPSSAPLTAAEKARVEQMQVAKQKAAPEPEPSQQGKSTRKTDDKATDPGDRRRQSRRVQYPRGIVLEIQHLMEKFPLLRDSNLRPVYRGSGAGKFEERMKTSPGRPTSFRAILRNGVGLEVDDITPDGIVVDNKERSSIAEIRKRRQEQAEQKRLEEGLRFEPKRRGRNIDQGIESLQDKDRIKAEDSLQKQSQFILENELNGGIWIVNDEDYYIMVKKAQEKLGIRNITIEYHD